MKRWLIAFAPTFVIALAACSGAASLPEVETAASIEAEAPPVPQRPLASLLPGTVEFVLHVDSQALRGSGAYEQLMALPLANGLAQENGAISPDSISEMYAVGGMPEAPNAVLAVFRTTYGEAELIESGGTTSPREARGPHGIYRLSSGNVAAFIGGHTVVMGPDAAVAAVLDAQDSGEGTGITDERILALMAQVGFAEHPIAGVGRFSDLGRAVLPLPALVFDSLESAGFVVSGSETLKASLMVNAHNSLMANMLVTLGRGQLTELSQRPEVQATVLGALIRETSLSTEGPTAWARVNVTGAQLTELVELLQANGSASTTP